MNLQSTDFFVQWEYENVKPLIKTDEYKPTMDVNEFNNSADDNCYWTNLTFFMMRAPITQCLIFIGKNYRDIDLEDHIEKQDFHLLDLPWTSKPGIDRSFDGNGGMIVAFYCLKATNSRPSKDGGLKSPYFLRVNQTHFGNLHSVQLDNVETRPIQQEDVTDCFRKLNMEYPNHPTMILNVIHFFCYLCRQEFKSNADINNFCAKHDLGFYAGPHQPFHKNVVAFRTYLCACIPIKLTPIDGQHRSYCTTVATEFMMLDNRSPLVAKQGVLSRQIPFDSDLHQKMRVTWLFRNSDLDLKDLIHDMSKKKNEAGRKQVWENFPKVMGNLCGSIAANQVHTGNITWFYANRFEPQEVFRLINGVQVANTNFIHGFAAQFLVAIREHWESNKYLTSDSANLSKWGGKKNQQEFDDQFQRMMKLSANRGWAEKSSGRSFFPKPTMNLMLEPLAHIFYSPEILKAFQRILKSNWEMEQESFVPGLPRIKDWTP